MTLTNTVWASQVAAAADLPDKRLDKRQATHCDYGGDDRTSIRLDPQGRRQRRRGEGDVSLLCQLARDCRRAATGDCHRNRAAVPGGGHFARGARHDLAELYGAA